MLIPACVSAHGVQYSDCLCRIRYVEADEWLLEPFSERCTRYEATQASSIAPRAMAYLKGSYS